MSALLWNITVPLQASISALSLGDVLPFSGAEPGGNKELGLPLWRGNPKAEPVATACEISQISLCNMEQMQMLHRSVLQWLDHDPGLFETA